MSSVKRSLMSAVAVGGLLCAAAPAASAADVTPQGACNSASTYREVTSSSHSWVGVSSTFHSINQSGVPNTVTFTAGSSGSKSATMTGTIEGGISGGLVTAKASVSSSISQSVSYSSSYAVQYVVAAGKTGNAQIGTDTFTVRINNVKYNNNCVKSVLSSGTLVAPTSIGWKTWMS